MVYKKGHKHSEETKRKIGLALKGRIYSEETLKKMSLAQMGKPGPIFSEKVIEKLRMANLSEKNPGWKGDNVSISSLHEWIRRRKKKPKYCVECKKASPYDLANISGKYKRDINDFRWLCRKCHLLSDGRMFNNLKQYNGEDKIK